MSIAFGFVPLLGHGGELHFWELIMLVGGFVLPASGGLILGVVGKLLARYHSPRWRNVVRWFTAIVLGGFWLLDAWFVFPAMSPGPAGNRELHAMDLVVLTLPSLLLIPYSIWLWRWMGKEGGDGVFP